MKLPIYKYLDLSTAHITPETDRFLDIESQWKLSEVIVYNKERGYFVHVPEKISELVNVPSDLKNCLKLAQKHGCNWLVLDGDAEIVEGLKTYEW